MDYVKEWLNYGIELVQETFFAEEEAEEKETADVSSTKEKRVSKTEKVAIKPQESVSSKDEDIVEAEAEAETETETGTRTGEEFSAEFLTKLLENSLDKEVKTVNATMFLDACVMVPKLFEGLGSALKSGNGKLVEKVNIVRTRQRETARDLNVDGSALSLQDIIDRDIRNKLTHSGKKAKQATRNIIRLVWFLDFITMLFESLADKQEASLKAIVQDCWANTLGPRNKWMVNKATTQALKVAPIPAKESFLKLLGLNDKCIDDQIVTLHGWAQRSDTVAKEMWTWLKSKDLESVP
mmetsp:Transcript_18731/g.22861  ORF Transcript_18731/g.22861 Transcript_18731/m.22861 type:complete len:296 (+) Transcript_18731:293-1180(+)